MASMFGFECEEEMANTKQYLLTHGGYQLEQVGDDPQLFQSILLPHDPLHSVCRQANDPLFSCIANDPLLRTNAVSSK